LHALALKRAIVTPRGDFTRADHVETHAISEASTLLNAVLVPARADQRLIVALGDSLTDGDGSTVEADRSWPSALARRLNARVAGPEVAIVNAGIAGNRLLADGFGIAALGSSALARFDRDVLTLPGMTHVVLLQGMNDLGFPGATLGGRPLAASLETPTAADLIGAYRQLIARANARGIRIIGATLTPCEGVDVPNYYTASKEATRQTVNAWIRSSGAFDGVIDFDAVLRDPGHPSRIKAGYASPDHLHPNDAGYQAMADAVDLSLFTSAAADSGRWFELDIYHAVPGKAPALAARFRDAEKLQAKHGLNVIGYWVPEGDPAWDDTFIYLVAHASKEEADRHWSAFHADPEFQRYVRSEAAEPLIERVDTVYMHATDYSRMK
jgi:lysophospholipase L1-like esterase